MGDHNGFHPGEVAVQIRAGERAIAAGRESIIRDQLNSSANAFVANQRLVAAAAIAPDASLWSTLWCGSPGFLQGNGDGDRLEIFQDLDQQRSDPVWPIVRPDQPLGLLVIDLATRRRLRINGVVDRVDDAGLELGIWETFGNCPKYIQQRLSIDSPGTSREDPGPVQRGGALDDERRRFIARTDTVFVASVHRERGLDVSHRGGTPGFIHVVADRTIQIPDYTGNSMFTTLGNFHLDPRCGLAFVDFERGRILSVTGHAALQFGVEDAAHPTGGTGRYWSCTIDSWLEFSLPTATHWMLVERSPFNPV